MWFILKNYHLCRFNKTIVTMENKIEKQCLFCKRNDQEVPLIHLDYKGMSYWICPQHIPVLIHEPSKLEGMLPGANDLQAG